MKRAQPMTRLGDANPPRLGLDDDRMERLLRLVALSRTVASLCQDAAKAATLAQAKITLSRIADQCLEYANELQSIAIERNADPRGYSQYSADAKSRAGAMPAQALRVLRDELQRGIAGGIYPEGVDMAPAYLAVLDRSILKVEGLTQTAPSPPPPEVVVATVPEVILETVEP